MEQKVQGTREQTGANRSRRAYLWSSRLTEPRRQENPGYLCVRYVHGETARLEHLRRHERSHTKEKPFSCGVCQRKFSRRDLLLRHAQKLHAGCADAITRLRRKSIKRSGSMGDTLDMDDDMVSMTPAKDTRSPGSTNPSSGHPSQSPLSIHPRGPITTLILCCSISIFSTTKRPPCRSLPAARVQRMAPLVRPCTNRCSIEEK